MKTKSNEWETTAKKNLCNLAYWTGAWMLTVALVSFGPKLLWDNNSVFSLLAILLSTAAGVGMILVNRRHINGLDELHRKITMDAMAIALGVGVVGGLSYSMLEQANVIPFDAEITHLVMLIAVTYLVAVIAGNLRYK